MASAVDGPPAMQRLRTQLTQVQQKLQRQPANAVAANASQRVTQAAAALDIHAATSELGRFRFHVPKDDRAALSSEDCQDLLIEVASRGMSALLLLLLRALPLMAAAAQEADEADLPVEYSPLTLTFAISSGCLDTVRIVIAYEVATSCPYDASRGFAVVEVAKRESVIVDEEQREAIMAALLDAGYRIEGHELVDWPLTAVATTRTLLRLCPDIEPEAWSDTLRLATQNSQFDIVELLLDAAQQKLTNDPARLRQLVDHALGAPHPSATLDRLRRKYSA